MVWHGLIGLKLGGLGGGAVGELAVNGRTGLRSVETGVSSVLSDVGRKRWYRDTIYGSL